MSPMLFTRGRACSRLAQMHVIASDSCLIRHSAQQGQNLQVFHCLRCQHAWSQIIWGFLSYDLLSKGSRDRQKERVLRLQDAKSVPWQPCPGYFWYYPSPATSSSQFYAGSSWAHVEHLAVAKILCCKGVRAARNPSRDISG